MTAVDANLAAYLAELSDQRRLSPHTVSNYRRDLGKLLAAAGDVPLVALQVHHLRRFVAQLHGQGLSGRSLARLLSAWRGFFQWLGERGLVKANPCDGIRPSKSPRLLPKALSVDEAARLFEPLEADDDPLQTTRDVAMFELFYSSGLRLAELVALNCDALDAMLHDGEVRVLGKRNKPRLVPVGRRACQALADWAAVRSQLAKPEEGALFVGQRGARISPRMVETRLACRAALLGLPTHVHPHMLGHASIASTQVYTHLDFQHLAKVYDAAHPRAKAK